MTFNSKLSLALMATGFSVSVSAYASAACVTGDCAAMGYNKTESACSGDIIRCPFDTSKVFCKENKTPQQKCLDEGYRLQEDWPKPTASNDAVIPSTMLANFMKKVFELKSALAAPQVTTAITDPLKAVDPIVPIGPIIGDPVDIIDDSTPIDREYTYTFTVTATCPYDSNYVKGEWKETPLCAANCKTCDSTNTKCIECKTGYNLTSSGTCSKFLVVSCKITHCKTCVSGDPDTCSVCESGYTLSNGRCNATAVDPLLCSGDYRPLYCTNNFYCCPMSSLITECSQIHSGTIHKCMITKITERRECDGLSLTCNGASYCCSNSSASCNNLTSCSLL